VFADMGLPEADEELIKAQLASHIRQVIKRQRLTQVAAAALNRAHGRIRVVGEAHA
jgi:predicted XRE-type DNA-binding protein